MENTTSVWSSTKTTRSVRETTDKNTDLIQLEQTLFLSCITVVSALAIPPNLLMLHLSIQVPQSRAGKRNSLSVRCCRVTHLPLLLMSQIVSNLLISFTAPLDVLFLVHGGRDEVSCVLFLSIKSVVMLFSVLVVCLQGLDKVYRVHNLHKMFLKNQAGRKLLAIAVSVVLSTVPLILHLILTEGQPLKDGCRVLPEVVDVTEGIFFLGFTLSSLSLVAVVIMLRKHKQKVAVDDKENVTAIAALPRVFALPKLPPVPEAITERNDNHSAKAGFPSTEAPPTPDTGNEVTATQTQPQAMPPSLSNDDSKCSKTAALPVVSLERSPTGRQTSMTSMTVTSGHLLSPLHSESLFQANDASQSDAPAQNSGSGVTGASGVPGLPGVPGASEVPGLPGMPGASSVPGLPGVPGASSVPGLPGVPGASGVPGLPGVPEASGVPGLPGVPGAPEVPGLPGVPGASSVPGIPGVPGASSVPGLPGVPGAPSVPGLPGLPGAPSVPGLPGVPGASEVPGLPGVPGAPGVPGLPGVPGASSVPGLPGVPGASSVPGLPGVPGAPGVPGLPGVPGASEVPGLPGAPSVPGLPGVPGASGVPGLPGVPGPTGVPGLLGVPGASGVPGLPGVPGPTGVPGLPGVPGVAGGSKSGRGSNKGSVRWPTSKESSEKGGSKPCGSTVTNDQSRSLSTSSATQRRLELATVTAVKRGALSLVIFLVCYIPLMVALLILSLDHPVYETALLLEGLTLPISYVHALVSPLLAMRVDKEWREQAAVLLKRPFQCCRKIWPR